MSDVERDRIDAEAQTVMHKCATMTKALRLELGKRREKTQCSEHACAVVELVEVYLKAVCKIYSEQRAIRVKRTVDVKRILESLVRSCKKLGEQNGARLLQLPREETPPASGGDVEEPFGLRHRRQSSAAADEEMVQRGDAEELKTAAFAVDEDERRRDVGENISLEEREQLQRENEQLYSDLNSLVDEIKQIEGKVVEIARLQEVFTEKVLVQDADLSRVYDTAVASTENVRAGNEQIREAMKQKAGFRVWIMFFLIVMSFTLLFLDWYNP